MNLSFSDFLRQKIGRAIEIEVSILIFLQKQKIVTMVDLLKKSCRDLARLGMKRREIYKLNANLFDSHPNHPYLGMLLWAELSRKTKIDQGILSASISSFASGNTLKLLEDRDFFVLGEILLANPFGFSYEITSKLKLPKGLRVGMFYKEQNPAK